MTRLSKETSTSRLSGWVMGVAMIAMALTACQGQEAVNRVQPNAMEKSALLQGEWYFLQTVIDTPYSASFSFVGEQGSVDRITWEIEEDYLIGRRAYSYIQGAEIPGIAAETEVGVPIAMYKIESHFDIRRGYNPVTGEENNVIEENSSDRPWYQREFMRVDWSKNLITDNSFLLGAKLFDGIQMEPVSYFIQPGTGHPHEPKFVYSDDEATPGLEYMDIVNRMYVQPTTTNLEGFGPIPTCFLFNTQPADCAPAEITVRNSFLRVDPSRDYQPMEFDPARMERFGYFRTERDTYDRSYGPLQSEVLRLVNRHNLWERSHLTDENDESGLLRCTSDDQCTRQGSECDLMWGRVYNEYENNQPVGACTIPYRERNTRPIAYHLSSNYPEDLRQDTQDIGNEWNQAFRHIVGSLRNLECEAAGDSNCAAEFDRDDAQQMFVICQNPVVDTDHPACGEPGTSATIGDLRYNYLGWVSEAHSSSPLGYGPSSADPLTGEIIMGNAFIYGAALETLQAYARDLVALLNGDYTEQQLAEGDVARAWSRGLDPTDAIAGHEHHDHHVAAVPGSQVEELLESMNLNWMDDLHDARRAEPANPAELYERFGDAHRRLSNSGLMGRPGAVQANLQALRGTEIESRMMNQERLLAAGYDPRRAGHLDDAAFNAASPLRSNSMERLSEARSHARMLRDAAGHCVLHGDFYDEGLIGLARAIQRAVREGDGTMEWYGQTYTLTDGDGIDYEAVAQMLRHPMYHGVTLHEIGHTIGLRHNFSGSYDALNYHPSYWDARLDGNVQSRAYDPLTQAEIDARIFEGQYSTVMDYGHNFVVSDSRGLGMYDHAAVKMGYGNVVEVFTNVAQPSTVIDWYWSEYAFGWPMGFNIQNFRENYHYTDWPSVAGSQAAMYEREDVLYENFENVYNFGFREGEYMAPRAPDGRPMVPYQFCTDNRRDLSPECQLYDSGADAYEAVNSIIDSYWNYHIFNAYGRERTGFWTDSYVNRIQGRYFNKFKSANQIYSLYSAVLTDIVGASGRDQILANPRGLGPYTAGVGSAFQLFSRVIAAPEPGNYGLAPRADGSTGYVLDRGSDLTVDTFDGRTLATGFSDTGDSLYVDYAGFYYDKSLAITTLLNPVANFLGRDTSDDIRFYQLSFYSNFGPALENLLAGIMASDWDTFAPRIESGELVYPTAVELAEPGASVTGRGVEPNASFSVQLEAAVFGMSMIPETFDREYFQRARIWVEGGPDAYDPGVGVAVVSFTDDATGLTYSAVSYPDPDSGEETGAGARMIGQATRIAANGTAAQVADYIDNLNIVRRLTWMLEFGSANNYGRQF